MASKQIVARLVGAAVLVALSGCGAEDASAPDSETGPTDATGLPSVVVPDDVARLGADASLTAGIPGEGDLSTDEIRAWLDDAANHVELKVELPMGLRLAAGQEKGLGANPLTRAKIELGRQLYFDTRLSADNTISCATCHHPDTGWTAHTPTGVGIRDQVGGRNSPVAYNRILSDLQFWDGRAESLEAQAVGPIENPIEMGNTHDACVETLRGIEGYRLQFESVFEGVSIDAVGQALAAFERVIVTGPSPFDYHDDATRYDDVTDDELADDPEYAAQVAAARAAREAAPMSVSAIRGRELFFGKANCTSCHAGANLADETYRNLGVGMDAAEPDLGRYVITQVEKDKGAFKTPTVRNCEQTAPYMHDGSVATLEEVVALYNQGGHANPWLDEKVVKLDLSDQEQADLVAFMKACTGPFPKVETGRLP